MSFIHPCRLVTLTVIVASAALALPVMTPGNVSIGKNLQTWTSVGLSEPAPPGDLQVVLTSSDPGRLLLSKAPDAAGSPSITLTVKAKFRATPEFWLQALSDSGEVKYTVTAPGYEPATGTAALAPSGVTIIGPLGVAAPPEFTTTARAWPTKIILQIVRLDSALKPVEPQYVRGGISAEVEITSSDPATGSVTPSRVTFGSTTDAGVVQFKPARTGKTSLSMKASPGFQVPAALNTVLATVRTPGMFVADDVVIGENLQLAAALSLGEPAPEGGVEVLLKSSDPQKLLLSASPTEIGKPSIAVRIPQGAVSATYHLQALTRSGNVTHTAEAPGYLKRTGMLTLVPSGVILSLEHHGPPDEAELFRPDTAGSHRNNFVALLSEKSPTPLIVYTAWLDPVTRRSADVTVQPLRAGMSVTVDLHNANPKVATIESKAVIKGGSDRGLAAFHPISIGETVISVVTPEGFTKPSNATELLGIVRN